MSALLDHADPPTHLDEVMSHIANAQPSTPMWVVICTGLIAVGLVSTSALMRWLTLASHEGAHAVVADFTTKLESVEINNSTGETQRAKGGYPGKLAFQFVGYIGPSLFGLLGAVLLDSNRPIAALWLAIALLAALLWNTINPFGILVIALLVGLLLLIAWNTSVATQTFIAYLLVWSLLVSGFHHLWTLGLGADHDTLRGLTWIPANFWRFLHLVLSGVALFFGGQMMLMD